MKMISVIIPVYNGGNVFENCLQALFSLDYQPFEVILVDDASRDNSLEIAKKYPCKVIALKENKGPGYARNEGAKQAQGEILAFTDADCVPPRDWLKIISQDLEDEHILAVGGGFSHSVNNSYIAEHRFLEANFHHIDKPAFVNTFTSSNFACRKNVFSAVGGFPDLYIAEDLILGYSLYKKGIMIYWDTRLKVAQYFRDTLGGYVKQQFFWMKEVMGIHLKYPETFFMIWPVKRNFLILQLFFILASLSSGILALFYPGWLWLGGSALLGLFLLNYPFLAFIKRKKGMIKSMISFLFVLARNLVWILGIFYSSVSNLTGVAYFLRSALPSIRVKKEPL